MDWYLDARDAAAVPALRREVMRHLARHAVAGSDLFSAEIVVAELLANAREHARGSAWVSLRWTGTHPTITVSDLGPGFPRLDGTGAGSAVAAPAVPAAPADQLDDGGRGLLLVTRLARDLDVAPRATGGSAVTATLDLELASAPLSLPLPRDDDGAASRPSLPGRTLPFDESSPDANREAFLRALVVQLVQTVELLQGPREPNGPIDDISASLGRQSEERYRRRLGLTAPFDAAHLADCLVDLKRTLGGQFRVVEASARRVVLAAERCPFGVAVRTTPALCRVTVGVFGGIAARHAAAGRASVLLPERIAVGDPACRIVVSLDPEHEPAADGAFTFVGRPG